MYQRILWADSRERAKEQGDSVNDLHTQICACGGKPAGDRKGMVNKMSEFEDANVDKDILSQIFGDDLSDDTKDEKTGDSLFADSAAEEEITEEAPAEELSVEDILKAAKEEPESEPAEEISVEDILKDAEEESEPEPVEELSVEDILKAAKEETPVEESQPEVKAAQIDTDDDDVTVITKGTTINGGISSEGSLEVMGTITGDVDCLGRVSVYGTISGNVSAADVLVQTKRLEGNIKSEGAVEVAGGTVIIGDIEGTSATVAGAVKGNIDVNGPVVVDSTAIVQGSIKAKSIQVNTGAVVDGYCSLNYAGVNLDEFFEDK